MALSADSILEMLEYRIKSVQSREALEKNPEMQAYWNGAAQELLNLQADIFFRNAEES